MVKCELDVYLKAIDKTTRLRVGRAKSEPQWRLGTSFSHSALPRDVVDWLYDAASLTQRLRQASGGQFRVRVLGQAWERPMRCERRLLGLADRALALVRQVYLLCDDRIVVYARTVLPRQVLAGRYRQLARLGGKPLGEILFRDKTMRRSEVQLARVVPGVSLYPLMPKGTQAGVWGRRSLFSLSGQALLVSEIFIPPLPVLQQHRFRLTRKSGR